MSSGNAFPNLQLRPGGTSHLPAQSPVSTSGEQLIKEVHKSRSHCKIIGKVKALFYFAKFTNLIEMLSSDNDLVETKNLKTTIFSTQFKEFKDYTKKHLKELKE